MPPAIARVANKHLNDPVEIRIASKTATVATVEQRFWPVSGLHKLDALTRILEVEAFDGMLIFVRTKQATEELATRLEARGYAATALNGDMPQPQRERTVERLRSGALDIVVATDVAARGLDVERITHVINYDIPYDPEAYVHRIGRTGRAGRTGQAILFVAPRERRLLRAIEKSTRQAITPMELPTREQVNSRRIEQFKVSITEAMEGEQMPFFHDLVQQYLDETDTDPQQVAAALACLAQRDRPLLLADTGKAERAPFNDTGDRRRTKKPAEKRRIESAEDTEKRQTTPRHKRREETEGIDMERFRIAVGHIHEVKPGDIVGAIANEADIDSVYIGRIALYDDYSTVELPAGMPREVFQHLKKVYVRGQPLRIESLDKAEKREKKKSVRKKTGARKPGAKKPGGKKTARTKPAGRKNTGKRKPKPQK
jgi:ATP-dependent RNA helicase DeaD